MSKYELIFKEVNRALILKDGNEYWNVKYIYSAQGWGFIAKCPNDVELKTITSGMFFWKRTYLYRNSQKHIEIKGLGRKIGNIFVNSRLFIYKDNQYQFSLDPPVTNSPASLVWESELGSNEEAVLCLAIMAKKPREYVPHI